MTILLITDNDLLTIALNHVTFNFDYFSLSLLRYHQSLPQYVFQHVLPISSHFFLLTKSVVVLVIIVSR